MANRSFEPGTQSARGPQGRKHLFAALAVSATVAFPTGLAAQQPDRARTEALARRATERLQALQREADRLASEERTLIGDVRKLEIARQLRATELRRADADAKTVQGELEAAAARMAALEASEKNQRPELRARLVEIYKMGEARYLRLLLSTTDLRRVGQSTRTVAVLAKLDRDRVASHARTLDDLKRTRKALEARRAELSVLRGAAEKAQAAALRAEQLKNDLISDIDRKRDLNAQLAGELQAAHQRLQAALRDLASGAAVADAGSLPLRPFRGALEWPVAGTVARRFGSGAASNGIEIAAAEGADARAIHDGTVAFAGIFSGFGNLVILEHGSQAFSLYGDLLDIVVKKGAHIEQGQPVGTVGPTSSGANGLYFELRVDGQPVDPLQWLKKHQ
jgi:murein hydrolase activator